MIFELTGLEANTDNNETNIGFHTQYGILVTDIQDNLQIDPSSG
jgi:hypothetical protein